MASDLIATWLDVPLRFSAAANAAESLRGAVAPSSAWTDVAYARLVSGDGGEKPYLHTGPFVGWLLVVSVPAGIFAQISKGSATLTLVVVAIVWVAGALSYFAYTKFKRVWRVVAFVISALLAVAAVVLIVLSDSSGDTAASPPSSTRAPSTTSSTTTTTTTTIPPPAALPPRPPEERELLDGTVGEFFDRDLIIGTGGAGTTSSSFNLTTEKIGCTSIYFQLGQQKVIVGRRDRAMTYFRITLLRVEGKLSTVRVEEMPSEDWPSHKSYNDEIVFDESCPSSF